MSTDYLAGHVPSSREFSLLIDSEEWVTDGACPYWRVSSAEEEVHGAPLLCLNCNQTVQLGLKDCTLYCGCAECTIQDIEDSLNNLDEDEELDL